MPICDSCGHETVGPARFCERCGTDFPRAEADDPTRVAGGGDEGATQVSPTPLPPVDPEHRAAGPGKAGREETGEPPEAESGDSPPEASAGEPADDADGGEPADDVAPPPSRRRSPALLFLLGLLAAVVVGGIGAGVYFGLVKDTGDDGGAASSAQTRPSSTPATDAGTRTTGGQPDKPATFLVNVCGGLSRDRRCEAPGFIRSRNKKQFYIWVLVRKAPKGRKVQILLKDASTGRNLVRPTTYTTTGATKDIFTLRISGGPFRPLRALIRMRYAGDFVKFPRTLRITLR